MNLEIIQLLIKVNWFMRIYKFMKNFKGYNKGTYALRELIILEVLIKLNSITHTYKRYMY